MCYFIQAIQNFKKHFSNRQREATIVAEIETMEMEIQMEIDRGYEIKIALYRVITIHGKSARRLDTVTAIKGMRAMLWSRGRNGEIQV